MAPLTLLSLTLMSLFTVVQLNFPNKLADVDSYYHIKMANIMRQSGDLTPDFVWLPQTVLSQQNFFDLHWLFHVILIPFTTGNLITGAKIAAITFSTLALLMAGLVLKSQKIRLWPLWTILIFGSSSDFVYRLSMLRDPSLSLVWMLLSIFLMLKRKEKWLVLTSFTYVWLYSGYPLLMLIAGIYVVSQKITSSNWQPKALIYTGVGIIIGLVINPYFPKSISFLIYNLRDKIFTQNLPIGIAEWEPYPIDQLLKYGGIPIILTIVGIASLLKSKRLTNTNVFLAGLCILFGSMLLRHQRFIEYYPVFAVIFCATALNPFLSKIKLRPHHVSLAALIILLLCAFTISEVRSISPLIPESSRFENAANYLKTHTKTGSIVFHDYGDFPELFFNNTHNAYIIGLDPSFLYRADNNKFVLWLLLKQGDVENVAEVVNINFGANYIVWDLRNKDFLQKAYLDTKLKEVFRDENTAIFHVDLH